MNKRTANSIKTKKSKVVMLTCYDYAFAHILDEAGVDILLVGDSMANVVLGLEETRKISIKEMLNHTKAVALGSKEAMVVGDMPYAAYQKNPKKCVYYAKKFIEAGADGVKIEWFKECKYVVKRLIKNKIPVMGHIGLTPQTAHLLGGFKVQGKTKKSALNLIKQAKILEDLGVFSLVLECIPHQLASHITKQLKIPTIGIGAGSGCRGQVLVLYDFLGLYKRIRPKFVRVYKDLSIQTSDAVRQFSNEINNGKFPNISESFSMDATQWRHLRKEL
ncbi:MAG: 3-methyl-2-oxobutanoate hydroxymethyltransferase [Candidatus Omnitrophica bacterium]|nr:3-methyl-2-oxobutanoate hydroxymethyltransferase [Candidatus Omnitrophota bacterium]